MSRKIIPMLAGFVALGVGCIELSRHERLHHNVNITIVDESGVPLRGVFVSPFQYFNSEATEVWHHPLEKKTDANGQVSFRYSELRGVALTAWDEGHQRMSILEFAPEFESRFHRGVLRRACKVALTLTCSELDDIGWTNSCVETSNGIRFLSCPTKNGRREFTLPSGCYQLDCYGNSVHSVRQPLFVPDESAQLTVAPIDMKAVRHKLLEGQLAPDLREITHWRNASFQNISDLQGKVILLNFWGWWCGPCRVHIPELIKLHDEFSPEGLVIVSIHIDYDHKADTFDELDEMMTWDKVHRWNNRSLPYVVALAAPNSQPYREGSTQTADATVVKDFGVIAFPTDLLIDSEGKLRGSYSREKLLQLLKESRLD